MGFWVTFAIEEAITVVEALLASDKSLTPQQLADGEALLAAAQKFVGDF